MYHSGNSELEQLEDRHYRFNQKLSELEWDYADMRMDVRQHTENLVDWLECLAFSSAKCGGPKWLGAFICLARRV